MNLPRQPQKTQGIAEPNNSRQSDQAEETEKPSEDRIVMLSDGIFAIATTLLVLGIQIPQHLKPDDFIKALTGDFLTNTLFYAITFAILASYWLEHRRLMKSLRRIDTIFIWLNLLFLALVAFFPVVNNVIIQYGQYPEAVIVYTVILAGCGYSLTLLGIYAFSKHRLIATNIDIRSASGHLIGSVLSSTFIMLSLCLLFIPNFIPNHVFYSWFSLPLIRGIARIVKMFRRDQLKTRTEELGTY